MDIKKVKLSDIDPNPFRNLERYPLNEETIASLRGKIKRTGLWNTLRARANPEKPGRYQLAQGHHRVAAAREELGKGGAIWLQVCEMDGATMLQVMAADNDDAYNLRPGFILETVEAAKAFILNEKVGRSATTAERFHITVARFLGWSPVRIDRALSQLSAIEKGDLSRKAIETLPHAEAAIALSRAVKKARMAGRPITKKKQEHVAREAARETEKSATAVIRMETHVDDEPPLRRKPARAKEEKDFGEFISETARMGRKFSEGLEQIIAVREDFTSELYARTIGAGFLREVCKGVRMKIEKLFNGGEHEKQAK